MLLPALLSLLFASPAQEPEAARPEVRVQIDWQAHPAMHIPWGFFRKGLLDRTAHMSYRHQFKQTVYAPYLEQSGVRIFLAAAMAAERAKNPEQGRRLILEQLAYVEAFVEANPERYALVRSPEAARAVLRDTEKMVIVHSIEGGHHLLSDPGDAAFWAEQGVALITLMHLRDDELGSSGVLPTGVGPLINPKGAKADRKGERRGLTPRGAEAIVELAASGILVDLSHMTGETIDDTLDVTREHGITPIVTHGKLASIRDSQLAFTDEQVLEVYRQGGVFALGLSAQGLDPLDPTLPVPPDLCTATLESFQFHYAAVQALVHGHAEELLGDEVPQDAAQTRLAVGWSSDWNGWVSHSEPAYGQRRCRSADTLTDDPLAIDTKGLAHPGLLPQHWERLERRGMDLEPMLRSAERFLQLWEQARQ